MGDFTKFSMPSSKMEFGLAEFSLEYVCVNWSNMALEG